MACGTGAGGPVLGQFTFSGNVVARTYFARGGYWGANDGVPGQWMAVGRVNDG